jgi:hypothetical protein
MSSVRGWPLEYERWGDFNRNTGDDIYIWSWNSLALNTAIGVVLILIAASLCELIVRRRRSSGKPMV